MNTELEKELKKQDLEKMRDEIQREIRNHNAKLCELKTQLQCVTERIQENCTHEWVKELQMYQKDVYCKRCGLTDWEKSRF